MAEWQHGICDCCHDGGVCCKSFCCGCYQFGKNMEKSQHEGCPTLNKWACCCCYVLAYAAYYIPGVILSTVNRGKIREAKNIEGSTGGDFFASLCCPCCVIAQESYELGVD
ncbi:Plac8 onzin related protein 1 [Balamuthia mandrillaris]